MKVTIIGGGGRVGSSAAFALQCGGIVAEIQLLDANPDLAAGEAIDLLHGTSVVGGQRIYAGDYERARDTDVFIITAGLRRKPDESRLDLVNRNVSLFTQILTSMRSAGMKESAIAFVVSNPVDTLTQVAVNHLGLPPHQVLGLGTMLDSARLSSLVAEALRLRPTQVSTLVLGEHGDTMVPIWSSATVNGGSMSKLPGFTPAFQNQMFERARGAGAEVIRKKGGAGWAVALTIADAIHSIILDQKKMLPVSTLQRGKFGLRDVCLSVPTVVGRAGVIEHVEIDLWPKELQALHASARALRETYDKIQFAKA